MMDRKPQQQFKFGSSKNFYKNYIGEEKQDSSFIESLYNDFKNKNFDELEQKINSGEILNHKIPNGETLIHAVINNPELSESQILNIIKLLETKNVSIHTFNELNQTALHFATKNGFFLITKYLIDRGADKSVVDNNGYTPLHYIMNNLIQKCSEDVLFDSNNKYKKLNNNLSEYQDNINKKIYLNLFELLNKEKKTSNKKFNNLVYPFIQNFIKNVKITKANEIVKFLNDEKTKLLTLINSKLSDPNLENIVLMEIIKIKDLLLTKFYNDYEIDDVTVEKINNIKYDINTELLSSQDSIFQEYDKFNSFIDSFIKLKLDELNKFYQNYMDITIYDLINNFDSNIDFKKYIIKNKSYLLDSITKNKLIDLSGNIISNFKYLQNTDSNSFIDIYFPKITNYPYFGSSTPDDKFNHYLLHFYYKYYSLLEKSNDIKVFLENYNIPHKIDTSNNDDIEYINGFDLYKSVILLDDFVNLLQTLYNIPNLDIKKQIITILHKLFSISSNNNKNSNIRLIFDNPQFNNIHIYNLSQNYEKLYEVIDSFINLIKIIYNDKENKINFSSTLIQDISIIELFNDYQINLVFDDLEKELEDIVSKYDLEQNYKKFILITKENFIINTDITLIKGKISYLFGIINILNSYCLKYLNDEYENDLLTKNIHNLDIIIYDTTTQTFNNINQSLKYAMNYYLDNYNLLLNLDNYPRIFVKNLILITKNIITLINNENYVQQKNLDKLFDYSIIGINYLDIIDLNNNNKNYTIVNKNDLFVKSINNLKNLFNMNEYLSFDKLFKLKKNILKYINDSTELNTKIIKDLSSDDNANEKLSCIYYICFVSLLLKIDQIINIIISKYGEFNILDDITNILNVNQNKDILSNPLYYNNFIINTKLLLKLLTKLQIIINLIKINIPQSNSYELTNYIYSSNNIAFILSINNEVLSKNISEYENYLKELIRNYDNLKMTTESDIYISNLENYINSLRQYYNFLITLTISINGKYYVLENYKNIIESNEIIPSEIYNRLIGLNIDFNLDQNILYFSNRQQKFINNYKKFGDLLFINLDNEKLYNYGLLLNEIFLHVDSDDIINIEFLESTIKYLIDNGIHNIPDNILIDYKNLIKNYDIDNILYYNNANILTIINPDDLNYKSIKISEFIKKIEKCEKYLKEIEKIENQINPIKTKIDNFLIKIKNNSLYINFIKPDTLYDYYVILFILKNNNNNFFNLLIQNYDSYVQEIQDLYDELMNNIHEYYRYLVKICSIILLQELNIFDYNISFIMSFIIPQINDKLMIKSFLNIYVNFITNLTNTNNNPVPDNEYIYIIDDLNNNSFLFQDINDYGKYFDILILYYVQSKIGGFIVDYQDQYDNILFNYLDDGRVNFNNYIKYYNNTIDKYVDLLYSNYLILTTIRRNNGNIFNIENSNPKINITQINFDDMELKKISSINLPDYNKDVIFITNNYVDLFVNINKQAHYTNYDNKLSGIYSILDNINEKTINITNTIDNNNSNIFYSNLLRNINLSSRIIGVDPVTVMINRLPFYRTLFYNALNGDQDAIREIDNLDLNTRINILSVSFFIPIENLSLIAILIVVSRNIDNMFINAQPYAGIGPIQMNNYMYNIANNILNNDDALLIISNALHRHNNPVAGINPLGFEPAVSFRQIMNGGVNLYNNAVGRINARINGAMIDNIIPIRHLILHEFELILNYVLINRNCNFTDGYNNKTIKYVAPENRNIISKNSLIYYFTVFILNIFNDIKDHYKEITKRDFDIEFSKYYPILKQNVLDTLKNNIDTHNILSNLRPIERQLINLNNNVNININHPIGNRNLTRNQNNENIRIITFMMRIFIRVHEEIYKFIKIMFNESINPEYIRQLQVKTVTETFKIDKINIIDNPRNYARIEFINKNIVDEKIIELINNKYKKEENDKIIEDININKKLLEVFSIKFELNKNNKLIKISKDDKRNVSGHILKLPKNIIDTSILLELKNNEDYNLSKINIINSYIKEVLETLKIDKKYIKYNIENGIIKMTSNQEKIINILMNLKYLYELDYDKNMQIIIKKQKEIYTNFRIGFSEIKYEKTIKNIIESLFEELKGLMNKNNEVIKKINNYLSIKYVNGLYNYYNNNRQLLTNYMLNNIILYDIDKLKSIREFIKPEDYLIKLQDYNYNIIYIINSNFEYDIKTVNNIINNNILVFNKETHLQKINNDNMIKNKDTAKYYIGKVDRIYDRIYDVNDKNIIISEYLNDKINDQTVDKYGKYIITQNYNFDKEENYPYNILTKQILNILVLENIDYIMKNIFNTTENKQKIYNLDSEKDKITDEKKKNIFMSLIQNIKEDDKIMTDIIIKKLNEYFKINLQIEKLNDVNKIIKLFVNNILKLDIIKNPTLVLNMSSIDKLLTENIQLGREKLEDIMNNITENIDFNNLMEIYDFDNEDNEDKIKSKKVINDKCYTENIFDIMEKIKFDFRTTDKNGDTIIHKLISQYNIYAIRKLIDDSSKKEINITSYKNINGETAEEYLFKMIEIIRKEYNLEDMKLLIKTNLENNVKQINSDKMYERYKYDDMNVITEIVINCLYMLNEYLWFNMDYNNKTKWKNSDKKKLLIMVGNKYKEKLMIFELNNEEMIKNILMDKSIYKTLKKKENKLEKDIEEFNEELKELEKEKLESKEEREKKILDKKIEKIQENINSRVPILKRIKEKLKVDENTKIKEILDSIKANINKDLIEDEINYDKYEQIVKKVILYMDKIIIKLNSEEIINNKICKINTDIINISINDENIELLDKYYRVMEIIYNDFNDLEKKENTNNYVFDNILKILKINSFSIIGKKIYQEIIKYISTKIDNQKLNDFIKQIRLNNMTDDGYNIMNRIYEIINNYLIDEMKFNNDITQKIQIEDLHRLLYKTLDMIFNIEIKDDDKIEIDKILDYNKKLLIIIANQIYNILVNHITNLKKMCLLIKILREIKSK